MAKLHKNTKKTLCNLTLVILHKSYCILESGVIHFIRKVFFKTGDAGRSTVGGDIQ